MDEVTVKVRVDGQYACFTRPDLKVERMSYPCMTPSAARGVLDSILWKPEFHWHVRRIHVLNPVQFTSFRRNEINSKQKKQPIIVEEARAQRNSIVLRNVSYIIEASIYQTVQDPKNPPQKYLAMFKRRVAKGQCFRRPFLGCREFPAEFFPVDSSFKALPEDIPIGSMLLDIFFDENGLPKPRFFYDVAIKKGVLDCSEEYKQMLSSSHVRPKLDGACSAVLYDFHLSEENEANNL